jgi:sugar/nucleoside kinase (ribokinase family)
MIQILGDLIADISMRLPQFPVQAKDIHRLSYLEVGPGGACNVAIMAAHFGMEVSCLGEVGDDSFGLVVREGLRREGIQLDGLISTPEAKTPVAGVVVDRAGEPAYLGHPGSLQIKEIQKEWKVAIRKAEALFADGWAEHDLVPAMILRAFEEAKEAGVPVFFDPGPGNPEVDSSWVKEAIALSSVVLLNRSEAKGLLGVDKEEEMLTALLEMGPQLIVLKRGAEGLLLARENEWQEPPIIDVPARDATGAGDSLAGAVLYGMLKDMNLGDLGLLANATGAAKVQKLGTGHNMPTMAEIRKVLEGEGLKAEDYLPD